MYIGYNLRPGINGGSNKQGGWKIPQGGISRGE